MIDGLWLNLSDTLDGQPVTERRAKLQNQSSEARTVQF